MNPVEVLLFVVALYYGIDLFWLLPGGAYVFRCWRGRAARISAAHDGLGFAGSKLTFSGWLPFTRAVVAEIPAVSVSAEGVRVGAPITNPRQPPPRPPVVRDFAILASTTVDGAVWRIPGEASVRFASSSAAEMAFADLQRVASAAEKERSTVVAKLLTERRDLVEAKRRWEAYRRASLPVAIASTSFFLLVFVAIPATYTLELSVPFPVWVALYVVILVATQVAFFIGHRSLYPRSTKERLMQALTMWISPADAMIAPRTLGRPLMAGLDVLVVARATLNDRALRELASELHRSALAATHEDGASRKDLESLIVRLGVDLDSLLMPPEPHPASKSYCPRCLEQYSVAEGSCGNCGTVALKALNVPRTRDPAPS